jgi:hypothetical protein
VDDADRFRLLFSPTVDDCCARLHRAGWSVGEVRTTAAWLVSGRNGENVIEVRAPAQAEAWRRALQQAEAVGMAGRRPRGV